MIVEKLKVNNLENKIPILILAYGHTGKLFYFIRVLDYYTKSVS